MSNTGQPPPPTHTVGGACQPPAKIGGYEPGTVWCCPICKGLWYSSDHEWMFLTGAFRVIDEGLRQRNEDAIREEIAHGLSARKPSAPRVAESLDDLAVGMVVAFASEYGNGYVRTVQRFGFDGSKVKAGQYDTAHWITPEDCAAGRVFILADPPAPPASDWLVPADTMEALREAVRVFEDPESVGNRWIQYVDAVDAVLDAATEVER